MIDGKDDWYHYTIRQFNNMILDPAGFDIYDKYARMGIKKLEPYLPEFSKTMLRLCDKMQERRNKILMGIITIMLCYKFAPYAMVARKAGLLS